MIDKIFNIKKKKIVITGSNGYLGSFLVKKLKNLGCTVIEIDIQKKNKVNYYNCNLTSEKEVKNTLNLIIKKHTKIDVLINNAAFSPFEHFTLRKEVNFDKTINVNLKGPFFLIKNLALLKNANHKLKIINISSIYGLISPNKSIYDKNTKRHNSEVYGASKAGLLQMSRYFSTHLNQYNMTINSISPGGILNRNHQHKNFISKYSKLNPMNRMALREDILGAVIFLSTKASDYVNGQNIIIDGGMSAL